MNRSAVEPRLEFAYLARPSHLTILIHDLEVTEVDPRALDEAERNVVSDDVWNVVLCSRQDFTPVRLRIVVWPARPDVLEGIALRLHCESGTVVVQPLAAGLSGECALPRPGTYDGRARWQQREEVADLTQEIMREAAEQDLPTHETVERLAALAGREQYRLDLWLSSDQIDAT